MRHLRVRLAAASGYASQINGAVKIADSGSVERNSTKEIPVARTNTNVATPNPDSSNRMEVLPEVLHFSLRDRWATPLALGMTSIQFVTVLMSLAWYYFVVPRARKILDDFGMETTQDAILVIRQSNLLVNYWYFLLVVGPVAMAIDFLVVRWLTKELGLYAGIAVGVCVAAIPLAYVAHGHSILHSAISKIPL